MSKFSQETSHVFTRVPVKGQHLNRLPCAQGYRRVLFFAGRGVARSFCKAGEAGHAVQYLGLGFKICGRGL